MKVQKSVTQFTPGPWRVNPDFDGDIQTSDGKLEIASISASLLTAGECPPLKKAVANTKLIAAAPSLYHALEDLILFVEAEYSGDLGKYKKVLAQARGEK